MIAVIGVGLSAFASSRTAAEFKVREEIALNRISSADSTIAALRSEIRSYSNSIDSMAVLVSLGTVAVNEARARARDAEASISLVTVEYAESDSALVELIVEAAEPEGEIVLLTDEIGVTTFGFSRSLAEDYLTKMTVTIPAYKYAISQYKLAVESDSVLIGNYANQVRLMDERYVILGNINRALTTRSNEFEGLYKLANRAYKREKLYRRATVGAVIAGAVAVLLLK